MIYKCIVSKNSKRYYKNVNGKWKRITNKTGEKAGKGKMKYRGNNPSRPSAPVYPEYDDEETNQSIDEYLNLPLCEKMKDEDWCEKSGDLCIWTEEGDDFVCKNIEDVYKKIDHTIEELYKQINKENIPLIKLLLKEPQVKDKINDKDKDMTSLMKVVMKLITNDYKKPDKLFEIMKLLVDNGADDDFAIDRFETFLS
jgi:hypothetical protein